MNDDSSIDWLFFVAIAAGYLAAFGGWLLLHALFPRWWPRRPVPPTEHKWLDLVVVFVVVAIILVIGQVYQQGYLLPKNVHGLPGDLYWSLNNLIIYSPIFIILLHRQQSTGTVYLSLRGLPVKLLAGLAFGSVAVAVYLMIRWQMWLVPEVALASVRRNNLRNFLPVFLEGLALAFAFVRIRWAIGVWPAIVIPALLFAVAHIPRQLQAGVPPAEMAAYAAVTTLVAAIALFTLYRSRDIIWVGIVHYLMDVAIGAFM